MIFDMTGLQLERSPETTDFADLTTGSGAVKQGRPLSDENPEITTYCRWLSDTNELEVYFAPEPFESERWPILRRIITSDPEEEQLYILAEQAVGANTAWRNNTSPQITQGAQAIESTTGTFPSNTVRDGHVRTVAQGVRLLNTQLSAVTAQNNAIIALLLRITNKV